MSFNTEITNNSHLRWSTTAIVLSIFGILSSYLIISGIAKPSDIAGIYAGDVLVILVCLDLFTRFFTVLGALDICALAVARATNGEPRKIVWGIGILMFGISAILNNLAAVFVAAPIFLLIMQQLGAGPRATALMLALILINTNLGGAATPIGDFPAIILMASGVISFNSYLVLAFPLFFLSAIVVTGIAALATPFLWAQSGKDGEAFGRLAIEALKQRMEFVHPDWTRINLLVVIFSAMVVVWAVTQPTHWPFHYTALAGAAAACLVVGQARVSRVLESYDLKTLIVMAGTLSIAAIATASGALDIVAKFLSSNFSNPVALLFVTMFTTMIAAGVLQAGPAAAAMLPVITALASGPLKPYGDWVYVGFAGSICAGSSMFLWSATSGMALKGEAAKLNIAWGIPNYLAYGLGAAALQFVLVAMWISYAVFSPVQFWMPAISILLMIGGAIGLFVGLRLRKKGAAVPGHTDQDKRHSTGMTIVYISIVIEIIGIVTKIATRIW